MNSIPDPGTPSNNHSQFSAMEMADLSDSQRSVVLYERMIETHDVWRNFQGDHTRAVAEVASLKRGKLEMMVSFTLASITMALGGALISSFPYAVPVPWEFWFGWVCIVLGLVFGITSRAIVWLLIFLEKKKLVQLPPTLSKDQN